MPDIICLGSDNYNQLIESEPQVAVIHPNGSLELGTPETIAESENMGDTSQDNDDNLFSQEELELIESSKNEAERMAWRVLIRYAHVVSASRFIDIAKGHIDGCTYIGPGGLDFVQRLVEAGGSVSVPTTLNSVSTDRQQWQSLGVPMDYAHNSIALGDAYLALGCQPSFTCAPYLLPDPPQTGQDVCWGESNAVVYANSVLGARTEKYADYLDICAAMVGKTIATGVHLEANRQPQIILDATEVLADIQKECSVQGIGAIDSLFPTLGHLCGSMSDGLVPVLIGLQDWKASITKENLKAFCAAFGTTGTSPLIHIAGITPEALDPREWDEWMNDSSIQRRVVNHQNLMDTFLTLDSSPDSETVDLVALGNPHLSVEECSVLADLVRDSKKHKDVRIMACMSRTLFAEANAHVTKLQDFGVEFVNDTCWCMLLDPPVIPARPDATILTNSGKYAHYGPGLTQRNFRFGSMEDCVATAITGVLRKRDASTMPRWLLSRRLSTVARFILAHR